MKREFGIASIFIGIATGVFSIFQIRKLSKEAIVEEAEEIENVVFDDLEEAEEVVEEVVEVNTAYEDRHFESEILALKNKNIHDNLELIALRAEIERLNFVLSKSEELTKEKILMEDRASMKQPANASVSKAEIEAWYYNAMDIVVAELEKSKQLQERLDLLETLNKSLEIERKQEEHEKMEAIRAMNNIKIDSEMKNGTIQRLRSQLEEIQNPSEKKKVYRNPF